MHNMQKEPMCLRLHMTPSSIVSFACQYLQVSVWTWKICQLSRIFRHRHKKRWKKGQKIQEEESRHLDESWGSAGRRGVLEKDGRWVGGWAVSFSCSFIWVCAVIRACACMVHMCISAGGVEQGVIPDGHSYKRQIPPTSIMLPQFGSSPECVQHRHSILTFKSDNIRTGGALAREAEMRFSAESLQKETLARIMARSLWIAVLVRYWLQTV